MKDKILILVPAITAQGGITNYFETLNGNWSLPVEYLERGARYWPNRSGTIPEIIRALRDLRKFKRQISSKNYALVQTNTSIGLFALIRDGLFIRSACRKGIPTIVFFRGLDHKFINIINKRLLFLFKYFFFKSNAFIVLSTHFKDRLLQWGFSKPIYVESTIIDEKLLDNYSQETRIKTIDFQLKKNILFLARVEKEKGIFTLLEAYEKLKSMDESYSLTIAGKGSGLPFVRKMTQEKNLKDVVFKNELKGNEKSEVYSAADIYVLPSWTEGMPNSVLEAIGFGLPIITTKVGGLSDILEDGKTGYFVNQNAPEQIVQYVQEILHDKDLYKGISVYNNKLGVKFYASMVRKRIENIYKTIIP